MKPHPDDAHIYERKTRQLNRVLMAIAVLIVSLIAWRIVATADRDPADPSTTLAQIEQQVTNKFSAPETTTADLSRALEGGRVMLFDVRTKAEFDQGHIAGAIHVDPDMSAPRFFAKYRDTLGSKTAVFYCSVGVRSGIMVNRIAGGDISVLPVNGLNLRGGLFRWHSEGRPVVTSQNVQASKVHPYNDAWGRLLERTLASQPQTRP